MLTSILMCLRTMLKPISLSLSRSHLQVQAQEQVQVQVQVKVQVREQGQVQVQLHLPTPTPDSLLRWRGEQPVRPVALVQGARLGNYPLHPHFNLLIHHPPSPGSPAAPR